MNGVRWDALAEVALMTTSRGPFQDDVFFVLTHDDGSNNAILLVRQENWCQGCSSCRGSTT